MAVAVETLYIPTSEPQRHTVRMHASAIISLGLAMTLTFDL